MTELAYPRKAPWIIALLVAIVLPILTFATQQGQCFDAAAGGGESLCSSGPTVGWAGAWLITAACVILLVISVVNLLRRRSAD